MKPLAFILTGLLWFSITNASGQSEKRELIGEETGTIRIKKIWDDQLVSFRFGNHVITFNFLDIPQGTSSFIFPIDSLPTDTLTFDQLSERTEQLGGTNWRASMLKFKIKSLIDRGQVSIYHVLQKVHLKKVLRTVAHRGNYEGIDYIYTNDDNLVFEINRPFTGCPSF